MRIMERANRVGAAARVQGNEYIAWRAVVSLLDFDSVAELFEDCGPAQGGNLVAVVELERRWGDELYSHAAGYFAQVRNPAQTSRRSGV